MYKNIGLTQDVSHANQHNGNNEEEDTEERMITIKTTITILASSRMHDNVLFIINTLSAVLNAPALQNSMNSDWLSMFNHSSAGK